MIEPWINEPFARPSSQMSGISNFTASGRFTAREPEQISEELKENFNPCYVSTRPGPGGSKLSYIEGWKVIERANEIFNFDGWSSQVVKMETDYTDLIDGKWNVGINIIIRVTLTSGTFHEDVGFGSATNERNKGAALEKARKEASTDALKRALRLFGNNLGNCIYNKNYLQASKNAKRHAPQTNPFVPPTPLKPAYSSKAFSNASTISSSNNTSGITTFNPSTGANFPAPATFSNQAIVASALNQNASNPFSTGSSSTKFSNINQSNTNNSSVHENTNINGTKLTNSTLENSESNTDSTSNQLTSNSSKQANTLEQSKFKFSNTSNSITNSSSNTANFDPCNNSLPVNNQSTGSKFSNSSLTNDQYNASSDFNQGTPNSDFNSSIKTSSSSNDNSIIQNKNLSSSFFNEFPDDIFDELEIQDLENSALQDHPQPIGIINPLFQSVIKPNSSQPDSKPTNSQAKKFDIFSASKRYKNGS